MHETNFVNFVNFFWEKTNLFFINYKLYFSIEKLILFVIAIIIIYNLFSFIQAKLEKGFLDVKKIKKIKNISIFSKVIIFSFSIIFFLINFEYLKNIDTIIVEVFNNFFILLDFFIYIISFVISFLMYSFFITDLKYKFVPNNLNYLFIILSLVFSVVVLFLDGKDGIFTSYFIWNLVQSILITSPFLILYIYSDSKLIGGADWKVIFGMSLLLSSFDLSYSFITISFVLGAFIAIIFYFLGNFSISKKNKVLPFIPFLIVSFILVYFLKMLIL